MRWTIYRLIFRSPLHLDHGTTREACEAAIEAGFSSIMFDGSHLPFAENLAITAIWSTGAQQRHSVEAELGTIAGSEDGIVNSEVIYADPQECFTGQRNAGRLPRRRARFYARAL
ncbi:hypothetical protein DMH17_04685 [Raoultella planticola]|nr:hypothetical protein [Raoultella planticola]